MAARRPNIKPDDLMDVNEVAEAFGVSTTSIRVARSQPDKFRALADKLPEPLRMVANTWVWLRFDVEQAVRKSS